MEVLVEDLNLVEIKGVDSEETKEDLKMEVEADLEETEVDEGASVVEGVDDNHFKDVYLIFNLLNFIDQIDFIKIIRKKTKYYNHF